MRNDVINHITLDLGRQLANKSVSMKKNDTKTRTLHFTLMSEGEVYTLENILLAIIRGKKPDGTMLYNDCVIDGNEVQYEVTSQTIAVTGEVVCELVLIDRDNAELCSSRFTIVVYDCIFDDSVVESQNEYAGLKEIINVCGKAESGCLSAEERVKELLEKTLNAQKSAEECKALAEEYKKVCLETTGFIEKQADIIYKKIEKNTQAISELANTDYETPTERENLTPGEELKKALGKIRRIFSDLKAVAFSGKYNDLSGTPDIPKKVSELENDEGFVTNNDIASKADKNSPIFTGTPKAPTAATGTSTTQIATTAFVQTAVSNGIAASDAMIIKGTIGTTGTVTSLPTTYKTGWTYRVVTEGTYAGQVCEIGDLIVALVDRNGTNNLDSDWCVAQTNINGAITGIKSGDAYISASQSGSVVTITHKDVSRTNTSSAASPSNGGTFTVVDKVTSDAKGHIKSVNTKTITLPAIKDGNATPGENGALTLDDVDTSLSDSSVNPVQNKVVQKAIAEISGAVDSKADKNSPILSGTPKAPTATAGTSTTQIATTAFVQNTVSNHNTSSSVHGDIRDLITVLTSRLNALADSDDTTLDQLSEIVTYIKSNRSLIENVTTNKVNVSDIINNLTSNVINKPLSAKQGKILNDLIASLADEVANITPENIGAAPYAVVETGDFNDMTTPGLYTMKNGNTNAPTTEKYYYSLIVLRSDSGTYVQQMAIAEGTTDVYVRYGSNSTWGEWVKLMVAGDTAANAAMLGGHTASYFSPWILQKVKIDLNHYTSLGDSSLTLKGNSIEIGRHTDVAVLGVDTMGCWLAGWSYSGLTLSVNVVTAGGDESATVCYLAKE